MARHKNTVWNISGEDSDPTVPTQNCILAVLMDIRDELQEMNRRHTAGEWKLRYVEEHLRRIDKRLLKNLPVKLKRKRK